MSPHSYFRFYYTYLFKGYKEINLFEVFTVFSGIVLAGGKSKRMGSDKRFIRFFGKTLLDISIERLRRVTEEVLVVFGDREELYFFKDVRFVFDMERGKGPMVGLLSGLQEMKGQYGVVTSVDTPLVTVDFLGSLKEKACGFDAVIPRWSRGIEPLIAVYSKGLVPVIRDWVYEGKSLSLHLFIERGDFRVRFLEEEEIKRFGSPEVLFFNVNTRKDLARLKTLWRAYRDD